MEERRRSTRVELNTDFDHSTNKMTKAKNVSEHGLCIMTGELYDVGKYFKRNFILPTGTGISILGKVMWSKAIAPQVCESGIAFISIGQADKEHLLHYIRKKRT